MTARLVLIGAGVLTGLYGGWLLLDTGSDNTAAAVIWLAGGVVAHDAILAPLTIGLAWLGLRLRRRMPDDVGRIVGPRVAAAVVVLGTVTVVAVPVLGRFGSLQDNPTLLPRNYVAGWLLLVGVVVLVTLGTILAKRVRDRRTDPGDESIEGLE